MSSRKESDALDPETLERHRTRLFKYAMLQLRNQALAEDAVQETMIAALKSLQAGGARFEGGSSLSTWLTGILKHKIIDIHRRSSREQTLDHDAEDSNEDEWDTMFVRDGHWRDRPADWGDPQATLEQKKFFAVLEMCMEGLPANTARVFAMREVMGRDTEEICADLGITSANCWVLLHRARLRLRECLEKNWFGGPR